MCLAGTVVASWSLTQEVAGSKYFTVMTNIFANEFIVFSENIWEKLNLFLSFISFSICYQTESVYLWGDVIAYVTK